MKEETNENAGAMVPVNSVNDSTAVAVVGNGGNNHDPFNVLNIVAELDAKDKLELVRDLAESEAALATIAMPNVTSLDLIGVNFDVLDASFKEIVDTDSKNGELKTVVSFVLLLNEAVTLEERTFAAGEQVTCLKSSNFANDSYVNYFNKRRGLGFFPLKSYTFVEDKRYRKAGNNAVVLQQVKAEAKTVSAAKKR